MRIKTITILFCEAVVVFLTICILGQCNKNPSDAKRPFTVSAGPDSTVALNEEVYLVGSASEGGVADSVFVYSWKHVSGPDSAQILFPSARITRVLFDQTGPYQILLTVSDGDSTKSVMVQYTVIDSILFKVLKPAAGDRIVIGSSVTIRWQTVTPFSQTMIDVSVDKGTTWTVLTIPSVLNKTQWVWQVSTTLQPCDSCLLKIRDYNNSSNYVLSGYFSLVKS